MIFYKVEAIREEAVDVAELSRPQQRALAMDVCEKSRELFLKCENKARVFVGTIHRHSVVLGVIAENSCVAEQQLEVFVKVLPFGVSGYKTEEIVFGGLLNLLMNATRNDYIEDDDEVLEGFDIQPLNNHHGEQFGENIIELNMTADAACKVAENQLFHTTLSPEIARIYTPRTTKKVHGHPVHYILQCDDREVRKTVYKTLLSALYAAGRLENRRYAFVNFNGESRFPGAAFDALYRSNSGGAVVVRFLEEDGREGTYGGRTEDLIAVISEIAFKYKQSVLTVICLPRNSNKLKATFLNYWGTTSFIELHEDVAFGEQAAAFLKNKAKEAHLRVDKRLLAAVQDDTVSHTVAELNCVFGEWYDNKLRTGVYPQYKTAETAKAKLKKAAPQGSAYERLQALIGLTEAKKVMEQALNYFKAQKLFADRGMQIERPSMHMVFTGNPGTAKTTVARLFAQIMRDNGLLANGDIVEVGRADLVGKYVGHTAPQVQAAFRKARGGVLFIDEAYSLVDDRDGLYGDEAISTIVQEMENHRDDTVVIFAGYPDKMEGFLNKNPGLRSRIAFHVPFADYTSEELCRIAALVAKEKALTLSDEAAEKLLSLFESARKQADFGNGRYVRNVIEKAKMALAGRLVHMDLNTVSDRDIATICAEDIEQPQGSVRDTVKKIGFIA